MIKDNKKTTSVFILKEILEHIENNPKIKNLSEFLNTRYIDEFMDIEKEEIELKRLIAQTKQTKKRILLMQKKQEKIIIPKLANKWIIFEAVGRIKRGFTPEGILKAFNDKFRLDVNLRQFKILLKKAERGK